MTATDQFILRRERTLPVDRLLRKAAQQAEVAGEAWELLVAAPPPSLGISHDRTVETLIVGERAAQRHGLRVKWGRWDPDEEVVHLDDGRVLDASGRIRRRSGDGR